MKVLGLSGSERHAAAAVSIDGVIVAAATEDSFVRVPDTGYRPWGRYPLAAIEACLGRARLSICDIDRIVIVDDGASGSRGEDAHADARPSHESGERAHIERVVGDRRHAAIAPAIADANQIASDDEPILIEVLSPESSEPAAFERCSGVLKRLPDRTGTARLLCAIARVTQALNVGRSGYAAVERLAALAGDGDGESFERAIGWNPETGIHLDERELARAIQPLHDSAAAAASGFDASQSNQVVRQRIAAGFSRRVNDLVSAIVEHLIARHGEGHVALAGALMANRGIATAAARAGRGSLMLAAVPEASGRALGAALDGPPATTAVGSLALGPEFSEPEIKLALENCRLDYLYEPDWPRLLTRISNMLARGTVVAWFHGPMGFGPRSIGTRSILCDPSNRYARENINRFLRHGSLDDPLPVAMTQAAADEALDGFFGSPFMPIDGNVRSRYRDKLRAAIGAEGAAPVRVVTAVDASALVELLDLHRQRTGVPGLIDVPLAGVNEPCACTPRDAIRTTFSSAIDAIVIGRFLLMKDYWLLRSGTDA